MFTKNFNFRIDEQTFARLSMLSKTLKRSKSNSLRFLIFQEFLRQDLNTSCDKEIPADIRSTNQS